MDAQRSTATADHRGAGNRPRHASARRRRSWGVVSIEYLALGAIVAAGMGAGLRYVNANGDVIGHAILQPVQSLVSGK